MLSVNVTDYLPHFPLSPNSHVLVQSRLLKNVSTFLHSRWALYLHHSGAWPYWVTEIYQQRGYWNQHARMGHPMKPDINFQHAISLKLFCVFPTNLLLLELILIDFCSLIHLLSTYCVLDRQ